MPRDRTHDCSACLLTQRCPQMNVCVRARACVNVCVRTCILRPRALADVIRDVLVFLLVFLFFCYFVARSMQFVFVGCVNTRGRIGKVGNSRFERARSIVITGKRAAVSLPRNVSLIIKSRHSSLSRIKKTDHRRHIIAANQPDRVFSVIAILVCCFAQSLPAPLFLLSQRRRPPRRPFHSNEISLFCV